MQITNRNGMDMGMKTKLILGVGMEMNHWEWEEWDLKKSFPLKRRSSLIHSKSNKRS